MIGPAFSGATDSNGEARTTNTATRYEAGDVVATPDGRGDVLATNVEEFSFP